MLAATVDMGWPVTSGLLSLAIFDTAWPFVMFFIGLSVVVFVHELGHFLVAKWCDVRVSDFAIGFGPEIVGFRRGETRYSLRAFPLGGYVKMLGQEDFTVDKEGELSVKDDPRSYLAKPVGQRMMIVSAGVVMNAAFAVLLFVIVSMVGMSITPAKIGLVLPNQPGHLAGLRPGDEILSVGDHKTKDWGDVTMQIALSDPGEALPFVVRGTDGQVRSLSIEPEYNQVDRLRRIGVGGPQDLVVADTGDAAGKDDAGQLRQGDTIVALRGEPVTNIVTVMNAIAAAEGRPVELTVERRTADGKSERVNVVRRARINLLSPGDPKESPNLLGASPRVRISDVDTTGVAYRAGVRAGDVVVSWDGIISPTWAQIQENIKEFPNDDQPVEVLRNGESAPRRLVIRPETPYRLTGTGVPKVGINYMGEIDDGHLMLARVAKESHMALAGLTGGDRITHVAELPIEDWYQLIHLLKENAGKTVALGYLNAEGQSRVGHLQVPRSLDVELGLVSWPQGVIASINNQKTVKVKDEKGASREYSVSIPQGARAALEQNVGRTVPIEYWIGEKLQTATVEVTPDLVDPWAMQVRFVEPFVTYNETVEMRTANPLTAMAWGLERTWYLMMNTYITIKQMLFTQQIGVENLSGPVGIVRIGAQVAEAGLPQLVYFLAFLSVNFAVVNFLPFPIVDGGHFMFLLIEKIKGKPLSVRVQMVTQVVGLAMILGAFLFLTLQDIVIWSTGK